MSTSFVSLQGNDFQGWGIVVKTFPILKEPKSVSSLSVPVQEKEVSRPVWDYAVRTVTVGQTKYLDEKTAVVAAKAMATSAGFTFVPPYTNIVVLGPFSPGNTYVPYELKFNGTAEICGHSEPLPEVVQQAKDLAEEKSLPFLYPNLYDVTPQCGDRTAFDVTGDASEPLFSVIDLAGFVKNPSGGLPVGTNIIELLTAGGLLVPAEQPRK